MRPIKFKIWDLKKKEWFDEDEFYISSDGFVMSVDTRGWWSEDAVRVCQFTGLLDAQGKEIWEGDVLRPTPPSQYRKFDREVLFLDGSFCYHTLTVTHGKKTKGYWALNQSKAKLFTVVGNRFEHPHLLSKPE